MKILDMQGSKRHQEGVLECSGIQKKDCCYQTGEDQQKCHSQYKGSKTHFEQRPLILSQMLGNHTIYIKILNQVVHTQSHKVLK